MTVTRNAANGTSRGERGEGDDGEDRAGDDAAVQVGGRAVVAAVDRLVAGRAFEAPAGSFAFGSGTTPAAATATAAAAGGTPGLFVLVVVAERADHGVVVVGELTVGEVAGVPVAAVGPEAGTGAGERRPALVVVVGAPTAEAGHLAGGRVGPVGRVAPEPLLGSRPPRRRGSGGGSADQPLPLSSGRGELARGPLGRHRRTAGVGRAGPTTRTPSPGRGSGSAQSSLGSSSRLSGTSPSSHPPHGGLCQPTRLDPRGEDPIGRGRPGRTGAGSRGSD